MTHPEQYRVGNAMRALEILAAARHSVPELAEHLQISVRTSRRLVQRLTLDGYLERVPGSGRRRYRVVPGGRHLGYRLIAARGSEAPG